MAFFAKSRRKLRTKNSEAHFHRKLRTLEKCSNVKKLRTTEPQTIFTVSYKKKKSVVVLWSAPSLSLSRRLITRLIIIRPIPNGFGVVLL